MFDTSSTSSFRHLILASPRPGPPATPARSTPPQDGLFNHNSGSSSHCSCRWGLPLRECDLPSNIQAEIQSIALGLLEFSLGLFVLSSLATLPICPPGYRTGANPLCSNFTGEHFSLSPQRYLWPPSPSCSKPAKPPTGRNNQAWVTAGQTRLAGTVPLEGF